MDDSRLEIMYEFCKLLENDDIRKEVEEQLKGYSVIHFMEGKYGEDKDGNVDVDNHKLVYQLTSTDDKECELRVSRYGLWITKTSSNKYEKIDFHRTFSRHEIAEKCLNGLIYSTIDTRYTNRNGDNYKELILYSLEECRYTFTNETMAKLFGNSSLKELEGVRVLTLLCMLRKAVDYGNLDAVSDFDSYFEAIMERKYDEGKCTIDPCSAKIYLKHENVSSVFDAVKGVDKINRVYDLYRGIINTRNEKDIDLIHIGLLSQDAYDLKGLRGITEKEDSMVGMPLDGVCVSSGYVDYLKQLVSKYGYNGDLQLDRDSVLAGILFKDPKNEYIKRLVELKLGISYDEYEKLDIEEQHKLIEQKIGRKVSFDYKLHIDGIPIDDEHVITRQQVDKRIAGIIKSKPKRRVRRLFGKK